MWRIVAGLVSAVLLGLAAYLYARSGPSGELLRASATPIPAALAQGQPQDAPAETLPEADPKTREQKRFDRYDKDRDGSVAREEYLASRRKAFARADANGDGRLDFDEWAKKTSDKFAGADDDKSGALTPAEFAATAVKRRPRARCACPPAAAEE